MLKEPRAGTVKTRLGRDISMTSSAWWFRHQSARLLRTLDDPRWDLRLCVTELNSRVWPAHLSRDPQSRGDLGQRMRRAFEQTPPGPMIIIGSDIPNISPRLIASAFDVLGHKDSVFGPAPDGGYWLIGLRRGPRPLPAKLFQNTRWSSEHALSDTLNTLGDATIGYVDEMQDVDTLADLRKIQPPLR